MMSNEAMQPVIYIIFSYLFHKSIFLEDCSFLLQVGLARRCCLVVCACCVNSSQPLFSRGGSGWVFVSKNIKSEMCGIEKGAEKA